MTQTRNVLTPDALAMMDAIARNGSFAGAARELGKVPSALTYSVRQLEEALDVLLFDRSSRQARLTAAGTELLGEGRRLLAQMEAVTHRVRRVASGWEAELTIAVDGVMSRVTVFELCEAFFALEPPAGPPTRLRLRSEILAGTWETLSSGMADLALGCHADAVPAGSGISSHALGEIDLVFVVAPHHPLAQASEPIADSEIARHRAIAVADTAQRATPVTLNLLPGQDVLTVATIPAKIEAQLRGLGCGFLAEPMVREHVQAGHLVTRRVQRARPTVRVLYAWRSPVSATGRPAPPGRALGWWLEQLERPATRQALLERHAGLLI